MCSGDSRLHQPQQSSSACRSGAVSERTGSLCGTVCGIDAAACDADTLCWIAMVDELEAVHDLIGVDGSSEPEDFLWAVSRLNGGGKPDFSGLDLSEDGDVFQWCAVCNAYLRQQDMLLCGVDIDSDDLQLILVTTAEYDKISALAEQAGHCIAPAETL